MVERARARTSGSPSLRVLILTQHFPPEVTAGRFRLEAFTRALVERGHAVHVVCAVPNHPEGEVQAAFRGRLVVRQRQGDLRVTYVWVHTSPTKSLRTRLANYASYAAMAVAAGSFDRAPDVVLATSPPLSVGVAGALVAARHRVPWVLDVRDLWPRAAVVLGELTDARAIRASEGVERWLYRDADHVVAVTESFAKHIRARSPSSRTVDIVPNGTTRQWIRWGEKEADRQGLGLPADRFVLAYAGNLGLYHGLGVAVAAAALLDDDFHLLLVGHGPSRAELERRAAELPDGRVRFTGLMCPERAAEHLRAADALLVSLHPSLSDVLSSKLFDYCAMGRPLLVAAEGETRAVVERADAAVAVSPGSASQLADGIRLLRGDEPLRLRLAANGRTLATEYLRERQAEVMASLLERVARAGRTTRPS